MWRKAKRPADLKNRILVLDDLDSNSKQAYAFIGTPKETTKGNHLGSIQGSGHPKCASNHTYSNSKQGVLTSQKKGQISSLGSRISQSELESLDMVLSDNN